MLVTNKEEQKTYIEEMMECKNPIQFGINDKQQLVLQNHWASDLYVAYFSGRWYASNGENKGCSKYADKDPHIFFAYGDGLYLEPKGKSSMEVTAHDIQLTEKAFSCLLFCHNKTLGIVVADGSKYSTVITEEFCANHSLWKLLLMSICAMIRQHDQDAANEIELFWRSGNE